MKKIRIILLLVPMIVLFAGLTCLNASALDVGSFYPTIEELRQLISGQTQFVSGHYYVTCDEVHNESGFDRIKYSAYFFDSSMSEFDIVVNESTLNDPTKGYNSFYVNAEGQSGTFSVRKVIFEIVYNDRADSPYYTQSTSSSTSNYFYNSELVGGSSFWATPNFYMSDLNVMVGDNNINRHDYTLNIIGGRDYKGDLVNIVFNAENLSDDKTFGVRYGVYSGGTSVEESSMNTLSPGGILSNYFTIQSLKDYATYHNIDYLTLSCYITLYEGIDVVETKTMTVAEVLENDSPDDNPFDDYEEYEDMPEVSEYFENLSPFPELDPFPAAPDYYDFPETPDYYEFPDSPEYSDFPAFPGFDPDHPFDSIYDIVKWVGACLITLGGNLVILLKWIGGCLVTLASNLVVLLRWLGGIILTLAKNLFLLLRWIVTCIVTLCTNIIRVLKWIGQNLALIIVDLAMFLKDSFFTLIKNIGVALRNAVTSIKIMLTRLFVPNLTSLLNSVSDSVPAFGQLRAVFQNCSVSDNSITFTMFDGMPQYERTVTISAVQTLKPAGCSVFYGLSTVAIYATAAFGLFNIITSIFGISVHSGGGDE